MGIKRNSSQTVTQIYKPKMAYAQRVQKVMVQPINLIFRYLQNRTRVSVWLYENVNARIEGHIVGFDEYMNLVLDEATEVHLKRKTEKVLGRIMLKGDNITLIQARRGRTRSKHCCCPCMHESWLHATGFLLSPKLCIVSPSCVSNFVYNIALISEENKTWIKSVLFSQ